jgi:hypothetical protein
MGIFFNFHKLANNLIVFYQFDSGLGHLIANYMLHIWAKYGHVAVHRSPDSFIYSWVHDISGFQK